jgi:LacI family transcriptional regulator
VDPELVEEVGTFKMAAAYDGMKRLMERRKDFTAVFAIADSMAVAAMKALHEGGIKVPEDCSIIAIDGIDMSLYSIPTLTTLVQPKEQLGVEAVKILLDMIGQQSGNRHVKLETSLRSGGSVRQID